METIDRLIEILCKERGEAVPPLSETEKANFFRALCNVREPIAPTEEFLRLQDEYLGEKKKLKSVVDAEKLTYKNGIALFKGDVTTLNSDAVVNAANSRMLGCFRPLHNCIDNAIHSAAGVQLRLECNEKMQGKEAKNGEVLVTNAYNLPSKYVFHVVGPIVYGKVTETNENDLKKCYRNCLIKADEMRLKTIAFCCISTGVFGYPKELAAKTAVACVKEYFKEKKSDLKVIFNVFTEEDYEIYGRILG